MSRICDPIQREMHSEFTRLNESAEQTCVDPWSQMEGVKILELPNTPSSQEYRTVQLQIPPNSPLFPSEISQRAAAEQYKIIRTKIVHHARKLRVIAVSSACSQDGKTVTSINIAASLAAKTDASVLLIDADLRRPRVADALGISISPGLSDVLAGTASLESAVIRATQWPRLFVLPCGRTTRNPAELLDSDRWRVLLRHLPSQFSHVIVDATPINTVADYELVELCSDGIILVVRPDHTGRRACAKMFETVKKDKTIGVVMNCVEDWWLSKTPAYEYYDKLPLQGEAAGSLQFFRRRFRKEARTSFGSVAPRNG